MKASQFWENADSEAPQIIKISLEKGILYTSQVRSCNFYLRFVAYLDQLRLWVRTELQFSGVTFQLTLQQMSSGDQWSLNDILKVVKRVNIPFYVFLKPLLYIMFLPFSWNNPILR